MFSSLSLRGAGGAVLWGYRPAVELSAWRIKQDPKTGRWMLRGRTARVDAFGSRQRPLLFTAPMSDGFWSWGVESITVGAGQIVAQLGPPER